MYSREVYFTNGDICLKFHTHKEASEYFKVTTSTISTCLLRGCKCKGYTVTQGKANTHLESGTRLYRIWRSMRERCERKAHKHYHSYGGRGITICTEWHNYDNFREWAISHGYDDNLTIERIDVNGNYEPSNCTWIPLNQQGLNRRNNHIVEVLGEKMIATQCSKKYGIPLSTVLMRDNKHRNVLTGEVL